MIRARRTQLTLAFSAYLGVIFACTSSACGLLSKDDFAGLHPEEAADGGRAGADGGHAGADGGHAGADDEHAGASGSGSDPDTSIATPLPPFERCAQDLGQLDDSKSATDTSPLLSSFAGWQPVSNFGLPSDARIVAKPAVASHSASSVYLFAQSNTDSNLNGSLIQNLGIVLEGSTWAWQGWSSLRTPSAWLGGVSATAFEKQSLALATRATTSADVSQVYVRACITPAAGSVAGAGGIWTNWVLLIGGNLNSDPTIAFSDPYLYVVARGTDDQFWFTRYQAGTTFDAWHWAPWSLVVDGLWTSEAAIATRPGGRLFVAGLGSDSQYYLTESQNGGASWSARRLVDSGSLRFHSAPALATAPTADGSLAIFGTATDSQMWTSTSDDDGRTWGAFQVTPHSNLKSPPVATSPKEGVIHIFALGTDAALWMDAYRP